MLKSMQDELNARRREDFYKAWEAHKRNGFKQTQEEVDRIAAAHGITDPPQLAMDPATASAESVAMQDPMLYIDFENKNETPMVVAYMVARAVVRLHFDVLMYVNVLSNELRNPGVRLPEERIKKVVDTTKEWATSMFPTMKPTIRYEDKR